jgi:hypothetical protein
MFHKCDYIRRYYTKRYLTQFQTCKRDAILSLTKLLSVLIYISVANRIKKRYEICRIRNNVITWYFPSCRQQ